MNVILSEENGKVVRASLARGVFVSEDGDSVQSTELHESDASAARALLGYAADGARVAPRDLDEARKILAAD